MSKLKILKNEPSSFGIDYYSILFKLTSILFKRFNRVRMNAKNTGHYNLQDRRQTILKRRENSVIHRNRMYSGNEKIISQQRPQSLTPSRFSPNALQTFANKEIVQINKKLPNPNQEYV